MNWRNLPMSLLKKIILMKYDNLTDKKNQLHCEKKEGGNFQL